MSGLPYVLIDVHDIIETLSEFGIEYDEKNLQEDLYVMKKTSNGSSYSKLADLDIHIFHIDDYKTMLMPVMDETLYDDVDFHEIEISVASTKRKKSASPGVTSKKRV